MFSLLRVNHDGTLGTTVTAEDGNPWGCRHAVTARRMARDVASIEAIRIGVMRGGKCAYVMRPDGTAERPPGTQPANDREDCKRESGGACFCTACRGERAAARARA